MPYGTGVTWSDARRPSASAWGVPGAAVNSTTARWDGYLEFQRRPRPMLDWFARYLA